MRIDDVIKRLLDLSIATFFGVLTLPLQIGIAALVKKNLGSPVLFRQQRPGKGGRVFVLLKFRTMRDVNAGAGLISDSQRITPFGSLLRSTSLDELPSLWNVIKGDMSLVGPRPLLVSYLDRYSPAQARRHEVKPGITGLAQVSGRNGLAWSDRLALDVEYVDNRSLVLDAKILVRTVMKVLKRDGIAAEGEVTMPEFTGDENG